MDLKLYFHKVREVESSIEGDYTVVISYETPEGGRAGRMTEVAKNVAAKLVADGKARLAAPDEAREFYEALRRERQELLDHECDPRATWPSIPSFAPEQKPKRRQPKNDEE